MDGNDLMKQLMGGGMATPNAAPKGNNLLNTLLNSGAAGGLLGGAVAGSLSSLLVGKRGKKFAKSAVKVGGIAAIGGLAYAAYSRYRQQSAPSAASPYTGSTSGVSDALGVPPVDSEFVPPPSEPATRDALGLALVRAMIAAAKADGHIDQQENRRIFEQINQLNLSSDDKAFLLEELGKPLDIDAVVKLGVTPEVSTEIYTASLLAVDVDTPAEDAYLQMLAARLGLQPALVEQIHSAVDAAANAAG